MLKNVVLFQSAYMGNQESDAYERGDAVLAWWDPELQFEFVMILIHITKQKYKLYNRSNFRKKRETKRVIFLPDTFSFSSYTYVLVSVIYR